MKLTKREQVKKIEKAIINCGKIIEAFESATNPLEIDCRKRAEGRKEAFESVLEMLNGNNIYINIDASEDYV